MEKCFRLNKTTSQPSSIGLNKVEKKREETLQEIKHHFPSRLERSPEITLSVVPLQDNILSHNKLILKCINTFQSEGIPIHCVAEIMSFGFHNNTEVSRQLNNHRPLTEPQKLRSVFLTIFKLKGHKSYLYNFYGAILSQCHFRELVKQVLNFVNNYLWLVLFESR